MAQIARAEGVSLSLLYKWRLKAHTPVDTAPTAPLSLPAPDKPVVHRVTFGLSAAPVEVIAEFGQDQLEYVTARTGSGDGEVFVRVPACAPDKPRNPPRLATDELTVAANGVSHVLTTRRTSSDGVAEISLRFVCSDVPIEVSHLRGPLLEDALRKVMGECKKAK